MSRNESTTTLDDPTAQAGSDVEPYAEPSPLAEAGQQAGESAGHLAERATELGFQQADRGKQQAAEGITHVAESIRRVSMDMEGEQPAIANAAMTAADQAERVASYLQQTDAREIVRTVEDVARRQPLIFLGGAFLLGLAASRFIKAAGGGTETRLAGGSRSGYGTDYRSGATTDYRAGVGVAGYGAGSGTTDAYRPTGPGGAADLDEPRSEGI